MIKKTIEETFQKLSHREHVLKRPDTYIGSTQTELKETFIVEDLNDFSNIKMITQNVNFNSGFLKIFDEIIVNASDQYIRTGKVNYIKVIVDDNFISVENDGPGIPVVKHKEHDVYIPELIFAHLLTGTNYDDNEERLVGGKNGLGAKLTNIYSSKFTVETCDGKKLYNQVFENNLEIIHPATIKSTNKNYTKITYYPDFQRFGMINITDEMKKIILKRVIDVAVYTKISVYFNDKLIPIKKFEDFIKLYTDNIYYYEKLADGWEVGITSTNIDEFQQVSLVNGITTYQGGTHVNFITNQIVKELKTQLEKKYKKVTIRENDIKSKLFIFLNSQIINPDFDTQSKETLKTRLTSKHISDIQISSKIIKQIMNSDIIEDIMNYIQLKERSELKKLNKGKKSKIRINKLDDANMAGTSKSKDCTLFLAEGDCLIEDTDIMIIRDGDKMNIKIKDIRLNDAVITHNNNIGIVNNISKRIKKSVIIKLKNNIKLICSKEHRWFVYDKINDKFTFVRTKDLITTQHKMIINKNINFDDFIKITSKFKIIHNKYDYLLNLSNSEEIYSSNTHKFSVFNNKTYKFEMIECQDLDIETHILVSYEK